MPPRTLIHLHKDPAVNRLSQFAEVARDLDAAEIATLYNQLVEAAPRRHERGKRYLDGRTGIASSGAASNRREEHLAIALFNASRGGAALPLHDGRSLELLDYQTPLKARQTDSGFGKVDLFGVIDRRIPCVVELKVKGGDTPLRALLEGLAYCAVIEANVADIAKEAAALHGVDLSLARPALIVLAPEDYWTKYLENPKTGAWRPALRDLASRIHQATGLQTHTLALRDAAFEMSLDGKPGRLTGDCRIVSIEELEQKSGHG